MKHQADDVWRPTEDRGTEIAAAPAAAEWVQWGDSLYRKLEVEEAAAAIAWGNEARDVETDEAIRVDPPLGGVDRTDHKLTVFEFYEYGAFSDGGGRKDWKRRADEVMERWKASLPEPVEVVRVPIVNQYRRGKEETEKVRRRREMQLRLMMTARVMGVADAVDRRLVDTLDRETRTNVTRDRAREWITAAGVDPADFDRAWASDQVTRMVERAGEQHAVAYALSRRHGKRRFRHEPPDPGFQHDPSKGARGAPPVSEMPDGTPGLARHHRPVRRALRMREKAPERPRAGALLALLTGNTRPGPPAHSRRKRYAPRGKAHDHDPRESTQRTRSHLDSDHVRNDRNGDHSDQI